MQVFACSDDTEKPENGNNAAIAPAVERTLGKGEVACSNHAGSTIFSRQTVLELSDPVGSYDVLLNEHGWFFRMAYLRVARYLWLKGETYYLNRPG